MPRAGKLLAALLGAVLLVGGRTAWAGGDGQAASRQPAVQPFAIYYGWPSDVNGADGNVAKAVAAFRGYHLVVFGNDLVLPSGDPKSKSIISGVLREGVIPYGYVSIGVTEGEPDYRLSYIDTLLHRWRAIGAHGVLLDCAGHDYGVSRARFAAAVGDAHALGLKVLANAWVPRDVLGGASPLRKGDGYLGENDVLAGGRFQPASQYRAKLAAMDRYARRLGITLFESATMNGRRDRKELAARVLRILAPYHVGEFTLTDPQYSSTNNRLAPPVS